MSVKFNQAFKNAAVKKVLSRSNGTTIVHIAMALGVAKTSLYRWVDEARQQALEPASALTSTLKSEKSPNDWTPEERLNIVIRCSSLSSAQVNTVCREAGIYPHHLDQWRSDFSTGVAPNVNTEERAERKRLKQENEALKKELRRKEKALAEAAALLILQKKMQKIWAREEEDLP
jgi:transposase-like protein